MKKFEGILFCTDMDCTLLNDEKKLSEENREAMEYFKSRGGTFTFITGRAPKSAGHICEMVKSDLPYGCVNGNVYDPAQKKLLFATFLTDGVQELEREVELRLPEMGIQSYGEKEIYTNRDSTSFKRYSEKVGVERIPCNYWEVPEPCLKIVFSHDDPELMQAVEDLLSSHPKASEFTIVRSESFLCEVLPKGVNKGQALQKMKEIFGAGATIAVGDYNNDIPMLEQADLSFAVANAVQAAKDAADFVTVSNNDHAIAAIINGLDKGEFAV